jgi:hypothetical protein
MLRRMAAVLSMLWFFMACTGGEERIRHMAERRDIDGLIQVLEGTWRNRFDVRASAAWELGFAGDERAVPSLISALRDENCLVAIAAAEALDTLGWQPRDDEDGVLFWAGPLSGRSLPAREAALDALELIGEPAVDPLIGLLGVGARPECYDLTEGVTLALQRIGGAAVEPLIAQLRDGDVFVRRDAAEAVGRIADARAVAPLMAALHDRSETVRQHAIVALANTAALAAIREGVEVATYEPERAGVHPIVLLDGFDHGSSPYPQAGEPRRWSPGSWTFTMPETWWEPDEGIAQVQLVAHVYRMEDTLQVCPYMLRGIPSNVTRVRERAEVALHAAATGEPVAQATLNGPEPRACRESEPAGLSLLTGGPVEIEALLGWLRPYVEQQ